MMNQPQYFIDEIGELRHSGKGINLWAIKNLADLPEFAHLRLPPLIYVVDYPGRGVGQEFLLGRQLCGPAKFLMIREIGHDMVRLFSNQFRGRIAQFVILWGGRPMDLLDADPPVTLGTLIDTTYIKLTRVEDQAVEHNWRVVESSLVGRWWPDETWLLQEECVASGATIKHFVQEALSYHRPKVLYLFSACASAEGLGGIYEECVANGVSFIPVLNEAIVQVADVGLRKPYTDLGLRPRTLVTKEFYNALHDRYQGTSLCWLGDVGDSLYKPLEHLLETLHDMVAMGMDLTIEDFSTWPPMVHTEQFQTMLKAKYPEIHNLIAAFLHRLPYGRE